MQGANKVRIVGGQWRGSRLTFPSLPDLRPTPDRVRETLFNWLQHHVELAVCLDLFAGSGALGFEALSRGARSVLFVDTHPQVLAQLQQNATRLHADGAQILRASAQEFVARPGQPFDIVFLDPPFRFDLLETIGQQLESGGWLSPSAWIYVESPADKAAPVFPPTWQVHRDKHTGAVRYQLYKRDAAASTV